MGWGNNVHVNLNTHGLGSSLALAHTHVMLRSGIFSCTCTHTSCYALASSLALAHTHTGHATLWHLLLHLHTHVMLRSGIFSCTCTHTSCYALGSSLALAHTRHATLWHLLLHLHTHVMLRSGIFSCTCTHTHTSCYALASSLALAHTRHATLWHLLLHLHTRVMHSWLSQWNIDDIIDTCMQYMKFPIPMSKFNVPNHTRNAMKNMFVVIPKLVSDAVIFNTEMNERYVNNGSMMISQKTT